MMKFHFLQPFALLSFALFTFLSSCNKKTDGETGGDVQQSDSVSAIKNELERDKSILIPGAIWQSGYIHLANAVVYGEVVSAKKNQDAVTDKGEELTIYRLKVEEVFGDCPELDGVAFLSSESRFNMVEGQKILIVVNYYEQKPDLVTSGSGHIIITPSEAPLLELFKTKQLDFDKYTDQEIALVEKYYPTNELKLIREFMRSRK